MSEMHTEHVGEVTVANEEGLHSRPVMLFVDLASKFDSRISVRNVTRCGEEVDGKSAMHMMLLEATKGCVLEIKACGGDALESIGALTALVEAGFKTDSHETTE